MINDAVLTTAIPTSEVSLLLHLSMLEVFDLVRTKQLTPFIHEPEGSFRFARAEVLAYLADKDKADYER